MTRDEGAAYIIYETRRAAEAAYREMNGESVAGGTLHVELVSHSQLGFHSQSGALGGIGATSPSTTSEAKEDTHTLKLTNIPPSIDEASLLEKCHSLAGFSSLKLVQEKDSPTNYAWVNIRNMAEVDIAQRFLNGMILDGNPVHASQPKPLNVTELNVKEAEQEAKADLSRRFSFKLPGNVHDIGLPASVQTAQPAMIDVKNLPRLPSESQSLFQPVRCGLDLSSAHRSMLSTLPATPSGHPVPVSLNTHKVDISKSSTMEVGNTPNTPQGESFAVVSGVGLTGVPSKTLAVDESRYTPVASQGKAHKSKKSPPMPLKMDPALRLQEPKELIVRIPKKHYMRAKQPWRHSKIQKLTLSEAATVVDKASQGNSQRRDGANITSPFHTVKRTQTVPTVSTPIQSTQCPLIPSDRLGRQIGGTSQMEKSRVNVVVKSPLPSVRRTQTSPATTPPVAASVSNKHPPLSPTNRGEQSSGISNKDSDGNPFKQALARRTSPVPQTDKPANQPALQLTPPKKQPMVVSETVDCSHLTSKRILFSKYRTELEALREKYGVSLRGEEVEGPALSITGEMKNVQQVKKMITHMERSVMSSISQATFSVSCALLPFLADSNIITSLQSVEKRNAIDLAVLCNYCQMSLIECSQSLKTKLSEAEGPVCVSQVQSFVEMRVGYLWKVRHTTTGEVVGFEDDINKRINRAYTDRAPTCSFIFQSHVYVVDFLQMTVTDQIEGLVHSLIREPVWCRYENDDFGYKPLRESISIIIESIFQQGAPGFITVEGQQCVVDFNSTPMQVYSTRGDCCFICRQPEVEPSNLAPVVTLRVRGMADSLAPAEQEFCQILQDKITTEALDIPSKIQDKVTRLLLTTIARQYCIQCVYSEEQQVLKLSGAKENVKDVHRLLLQETVKIISDSDTPVDHTLTPPYWTPQTSDVQLCPVEKDTNEWTHIEKLMRESLADVRIETIRRIQNKHLWQKYSFFRRVIQKRMNGRDINEKELFHGTRQNDPSMIYESEKGFDFRFGSSNCLWGQGSYFAVKASYSDNGYAYRLPDGTKQLILARVVTGESKFMNKREKLSVPPLKPGSTKERYDTIRANTGGSEIYVVYDHEKAYPAYLITYRT